MFRISQKEKPFTTWHASRRSGVGNNILPTAKSTISFNSLSMSLYTFARVKLLRVAADTARKESGGDEVLEVYISRTVAKVVSWIMNKRNLTTEDTEKVDRILTKFDSSVSLYVRLK